MSVHLGQLLATASSCARPSETTSAERGM
jgi:hypothetical protein